MVKIATQCINFFCVYQCCKIGYIRMAIFTTLRGEIHNSTRKKFILEELPNSSETGYEKNSLDFTELYSKITQTVPT